MATFYSNRPIVTDGLVLYHDFGNRKCYPGTGTTCYDLSGNNHNGDISGSYTGSGGFVTESLGGFYTPNTVQGTLGSLTINPYISFGLPASLNFQPSTHDVTLIVWCKIHYFWQHSSGGGAWRIWGRGTFANSIGIDAQYPSQIYARVRGSTSFEQGVTNIITGSLYQITQTYKQTGGVTHSVYVNGQLVGTRNDGAIQSMTGSFYDGTPASPGDGRWMLTGPYACAGNQSSGSITTYNCSLYNRALSADEIKQNFNALRGRYGI